MFCVMVSPVQMIPVQLKTFVIIQVRFLGKTCKNYENLINITISLKN